MVQKDITLSYFGGSGGFFALHLLLLTSHYHCVFEGDEQDFEKIYQKQWNIGKKWKDSETSPDNNKTFASDMNNKVYFFCNPTIKQITQYPSTKILVYTDIDTQLRLSKYKNAYLYTRPENEVLISIKRQFIEQYNNYKDKQWPIITEIEDFNLLSTEIKQECATAFRSDYKFPTGEHDLMECYKHNMSILYKDDLIFYHIMPLIQRSNIVIKLQDLIKTQGKILFDQFNIKTNKQIEIFIDRYIQLHGKEEQKLLLK